MRSVELDDGRIWYGSALRLRRILQGWTAEDVAARLKRYHGYEVDQSTVWRWEEGKATPNTEEAVRALSDLFECSAIVWYRRPIITWYDENADAAGNTG